MCAELTGLQTAECLSLWNILFAYSGSCTKCTWTCYISLRRLRVFQSSLLTFINFYYIQREVNELSGTFSIMAIVVYSL